jgi:hypothetical protein
MMIRTRMLALGVAASMALATPGIGVRKSEAAVGVAFAPVAIGVLAGWLAFNAVHAIIRVSDVMTFEAKDLIIGGAISGGVGFVIGVILLDSGNGTPRFTELSPDTAQQLGITEDQRLSFNSESEEVDSVTQMMAKDVTEALLEGADAEEVVEVARTSAAVNGAMLRPGTRAALHQLAAFTFAPKQE